jgi:hypothetical protein
VDELLERGADPLALDSTGRTPLQVARGTAAMMAKLLGEEAAARARLREKPSENLEEGAELLGM